MYKGRKILCVIPARGGSKGLPRKNVLPLSEKPLIAWTIEEALSSSYLDKIIVSTDDNEIAGISKEYGAEVPFKRPKKLSSDYAKTTDVILHALNWLESKDQFFDLLLVLQPTSPFRKAFDINEAIKLLVNKKAQSIVSVCEAEHHPYWSNTLPGDGCMKNFIKKEIIGKNRQELPVFYRLNGAVYLAYCDYLKKKRDFLGNETYAYIMPVERSVDIDNAIDLKFAESLLKKNKSYLCRKISE